MTYQDQIDNILDNFDFARIRTMMKAVDWTWGWDGARHFPDEAELRQSARGHLRNVAGTGNEVSCSGGFTAMNLDGVLHLFWGVDSWVWTDGVEPDVSEKGEG